MSVTWSRMCSSISIIFSKIARFLLLTAVICNSADAQIRAHTRPLKAYALNDQAKLSLCELTNIERFKDLLRPLLVPRIVGTPEHRQVGQYLKKFVQQAGFHTKWDRFNALTPKGKRQFRNLIATFDRYAPRRLVLACHYDSKIFEGAVFIGATDSAVPCAMLLDIAVTLAPYLRRQRNPDVTLQLIFFDGEEAFVEWTPIDSIYGARHLAKLWADEMYTETHGSSFSVHREIERIDVMVLLDLLGAEKPYIANMKYLLANDFFPVLPKIENSLKQLGCINDLPRIFFGGDSYNQVEDDHVPFHKRGVPVLHLIPTPFPKVWHTVQDNESALHYPTIENLVSIIRVFVAKYLNLVP